MEIKIQCIHFSAEEKLEQFVEKKVGKLSRVVSPDAEAQITLTLTNPTTQNNKKAAISLNGARAEHTSDTFEDSIDHCVDVLQRQFNKKKEEKA